MLAQSDICRHTECERDAQHGPQNGFDGDSIEPLPVGREIFNALGICIGFACCEDEGAGNDAAGAAESQLKQENAGSAKTRSSASSPGLEGGAPEYTRGDEDSASMLMRDRHSASMSDTGDVPVGAEGDLSASSPAIDAHLRCQLESAITMLGLSSEQPHAALSTAGMNGLLGKVTDQGGENQMVCYSWLGFTLRRVLIDRYVWQEELKNRPTDSQGVCGRSKMPSEICCILTVCSATTSISPSESQSFARKLKSIFQVSSEHAEMSLTSYLMRACRHDAG